MTCFSVRTTGQVDFSFHHRSISDHSEHITDRVEDSLFSPVNSYHDMSHHVMSNYIMSHQVMSCHVAYIAAPLLVCGHTPSIHCTLPGRQRLWSHCKHMSFSFFLTQTKVGHGACIKHNIRINSKPI